MNAFMVGDYGLTIKQLDYELNEDD
jgi:hypothetical protein